MRRLLREVKATEVALGAPRVSKVVEALTLAFSRRLHVKYDNGIHLDGFKRALHARNSAFNVVLE